MNAQSRVSQVYEIRRYHFRALIDLRPILAGIRYTALSGGEYHIHAADYARAVRQLKSTPNLDVFTVRDQSRDLNWLTYREVRSSPRWISVSNPSNWTYLSPIARRWRRCLAGDGRILLRSGWALCQHPNRGRRQYFLFDENQVLSDCRLSGDEAIHRGYQGALGRLPVPVWESDAFLYALWPGYVIPKEHERFLIHIMSPLDVPIQSDDGDTVWVWHSSDRDLIEYVLRGLRLRMVPWSAGRDWVHTASLIIRRAYGTYFKGRGGAQKLQSLIRQRAWHHITDLPLANMVKQLCQAEWEGDPAATTLLDFMDKYLCVDLDWHNFGEMLEGWVIESSPVVYGQHRLDKRYYRLVVPDHEIVLGWETKRQPDWEGNSRPRVRLFHWRSLPYVGRLKSASRARSPIPGKAGRSLRRASLRVLLGLPSIEWDLAKRLAVGAFVLDLDGAHWQGCHDLCRYFAGYGRIVAFNPSECDGFGLLLEDVTGARFVLETHVLRSKDLFPAGEWVYFVAHSSLLHHRAWQSLEREIPIFELKMPQLFRRAYEHDVLQGGLLAMVKYHYGITRKNLWAYFDHVWTEAGLIEATNQLLLSGEVCQYRHRLYYRYASISSEKMSSLLKGNLKEEEAEPYFLLRTLIHPLYVRAAHLAENEEIPTLSELRYLPSVFVSAVKQESELLGEAQARLTQSGVVRVCARGAQVFRAQMLVENLVNTGLMVQVRRRDGIHTFDDGVEVDEVDYLIRDPVRELQRRFK